jgi:hypothetical protein
LTLALVLALVIVAVLVGVVADVLAATEAPALVPVEPPLEPHPANVAARAKDEKNPRSVKRCMGIDSPGRDASHPSSANACPKEEAGRVGPSADRRARAPHDRRVERAKAGEPEALCGSRPALVRGAG